MPSAITACNCNRCAGAAPKRAAALSEALAKEQAELAALEARLAEEKGLVERVLALCGELRAGTGEGAAALLELQARQRELRLLQVPIG